MNLRPVIELEKKGVVYLRNACKNRSLLNEYNELMRLRENRELSKVNLTTREVIQQRIKNKMKTILDNLPSMGYSMGSLITLNIISDKNGKPFLTAKEDTRTEYIKSSRYKARHGYYTLNITHSDFKKIKLIANIPTIIGEQVNKRNKIYKASWFETKGCKQFYRLDRIEGYVSLITNYHSTDKKEITEQINKVRRNKRLKRQYNNLRDVALLQFYGVNHSLNAGNCRVGTKNFIDKVNIDTNKIGGIRGDLLIELCQRLNLTTFGERIINKRIEELI